MVVRPIACGLPSRRLPLTPIPDSMAGKRRFADPQLRKLVRPDWPICSHAQRVPHRRNQSLAITANAFDEDLRASLVAGMRDHIGKPVDPDRLFKILLNWLQVSRYARW